MGGFSSVITIDGHRGTGKSRLANDLRDCFGCGVLEVGPIFRLVAWLVKSNKISHHQQPSRTLVELLESNSLRIRLDKGCGMSASLIELEGRILNEDLWSPSLDETLRMIAANEEIVGDVVRTSRRIVENRKCVVVGREVGTVFFPEAPIKILLKAKEPLRSKRKLSQLASKGALESEHYCLNSSEPPVRWEFVKDGFILDSTLSSPSQVLASVIPLIRDALGWIPINGDEAKR